MFVAYSLYTNYNHLFDNQTVNKNDIGCLNGIKVISLLFVILGHRLMFMVMSPKVNVVDYLKWIPKIKTGVQLWLLMSTIDNFLIIASLLTTLKILQALDMWVIVRFSDANANWLTNKSFSGKFKLWKLYIYRFMMITPIVAFSILFFLAVPDFVENTAMVRTSMASDNCQKYWWSALLHIQNYVNPSNLVSYSKLLSLWNWNFLFLTK